MNEDKSCSSGKKRLDRLAEDLARLNVEVCALVVSILVACLVGFLASLGLRVDQALMLRRIVMLTSFLVLALIVSYGWYAFPMERILGALSCSFVFLGFYGLSAILRMMAGQIPEYIPPNIPPELIRQIEEEIARDPVSQFLRDPLGNFLVMSSVLVMGFYLGWKISEMYKGE